MTVNDHFDDIPGYMHGATRAALAGNDHGPNVRRIKLVDRLLRDHLRRTTDDALNPRGNYRPPIRLPAVSVSNAKQTLGEAMRASGARHAMLLTGKAGSGLPPQR